MKKAFEMPKIVVEQFVPNEYVAACGDENKVYKFVCDAGDINGSYRVMTNGNDGVANGFPDYPYYGDDVELTDGIIFGSYYHPCGETHEAPYLDAFINGYIVPKGELNLEENRTPVIIWRGIDGRNIHCTTNLNINSWTTAKS